MNTGMGPLYPSNSFINSKTSNKDVDRKALYDVIIAKKIKAEKWMDKIDRFAEKVHIKLSDDQETISLKANSADDD